MTQLFQAAGGKVYRISCRTSILHGAKEYYNLAIMSNFVGETELYIITYILGTIPENIRQRNWQIGEFR